MTGINPTGASSNSSYPGISEKKPPIEPNFSYPRPITPLKSTIPDSPENNKSALIFPLATAALGATFAFAGRSDKQRIFGAVTGLTLLGEAAFAYVIRNKKIVKAGDYGWPMAMNIGTISAIVTGGLLAGAVHLRPNNALTFNALTFKKIISRTGALVLTELALKYILNSKSTMRTQDIQTRGIGIRILAIAAYTGLLVRTR